MYKIDHTSPVPLHIQVENLLDDLIQQTEYQQGRFLPKEVDLANQLGISRNTVRQAINRMVINGILVRKKGVGTTVAQQRISTRLDSWYSFSDEMTTQGVAFTNLDIRASLDHADNHLADLFKIAPGRELVRLERLRGRDGAPVVYFISWFHPRLNLTPNEDFSRQLYQIIEERSSTVPHESQENITAVEADDSMAEKLKIGAGKPVLFRERRVHDAGGRPFEYNLGYYRADKFTYSINIVREQ